MKKLLLITGAIVFIGNITGQRTSESLIPTTHQMVNTAQVIQTSTDFSISGCCFCGVNKEEIEAKQNFTIDHMFMTSYEKVDIITGGIPVNYGDNAGDVQIKDQISFQNILLPENQVDIITCHGPESITIEEIKITPPLPAKSEIVEVEEKNEFQGPFTGMEGHNFIEDPAIIYPNPVRDVLNIKSTDPITVIEILGIHGQIEMELDPRSTMDVSTLAAGTYYARIHFENIKEVQVEKILVVK